jgi:hypothetical protein
MNKQAFAPFGGPTSVVGFWIIFLKEVNERIEKIHENEDVHHLKK